MESIRQYQEVLSLFLGEFLIKKDGVDFFFKANFGDLKA